MLAKLGLLFVLFGWIAFASCFFYCFFAYFNNIFRCFYFIKVCNTFGVVSSLGHLLGLNLVRCLETSDFGFILGFAFGTHSNISFPLDYPRRMYLGLDYHCLKCIGPDRRLLLILLGFGTLLLLLQFSFQTTCVCFTSIKS